MARVQFTSTIAELVGKLAGSVFQYSYGGFQLHTRVIPSNPQTDRQQLRRGWFGFIAANWRTLTPVQQGTFITPAGGIAAGFRLFVSSNINLYLIGIPTITSYAGTTPPVTFGIQIDTYTAGNLFISASGSPSVVPAGTTLLIYSTYEKALYHIFQNPSEYSPIATFAAGSSLAVTQNITTDFTALYGVLRGGLQLCIKSVLIDNSNGSRGPEFIICSPAIIPVGNFVVDDAGNILADSSGDFIIYS